MNVYKITEDGCVHHWIIAMTEESAALLFFNKLADFGYNLEPGTIITKEVQKPSKKLKINFDGESVKLSCRKWCAIFGDEERYLACSEY